MEMGGAKEGTPFGGGKGEANAGLTLAPTVFRQEESDGAAKWLSMPLVGVELWLRDDMASLGLAEERKRWAVETLDVGETACDARDST